MPVLAFGLGASKTQRGSLKQAPKRKAIFDQEDEELDPSKLQNSKEKKSKSLTSLAGLDDVDDTSRNDQESIKRSSKLFDTGRVNGDRVENYTNLSSLRNAKLHEQKVSQIDASVYDYDAAYDTFHISPEKKSNDSATTGPKYMNSLLQTAEVRKRDQLRAKEKLLQREREAEGDEFADKEKFVTEAYKQQQEDVRKMEEEEKKREAAEEERRRKGEGMKGFYGSILKREENRMRDLEEAAKKKEQDQDPKQEFDDQNMDEEVYGANVAKELNQKGANIIVNDEGEVVDKRQLLSAGLNVAAKKSGEDPEKSQKKGETDRPTAPYVSSKARDAKEAFRERQSRMVERQIEEIAEKERQQEAEEEKQLAEKTKSRITEVDKSSARDRYLQRKKEKEEEAKKAKEAS